MTVPPVPMSHSVDASIDLTGCDREPIHVPGAIQPHGLLLIADAATLVVEAGAGNLEGRLSPDWLGRSLADLLGCDVAALAGESTVGGMIAAPALVTGGETLAVTLHRSGAKLLAELEPVNNGDAADDRNGDLGAAATLAWLDQLGLAFDRAPSMPVAAEKAAAAIRTLSGFDRVMVYRFLEDEAGCVVAEAKAPELGSFLHHHFPASDIPRQARALYVRNRTRAIPTATYEPLPIRPAALAGTDLSDVAIRSVSPIHLQYLRNMDVAASASISVVKDGVLWGLIACHHREPRLMPPAVRAAAATLASTLARQIRSREEAQAYRERLRLHAAQDALLPRLGGEAPFDRQLAAVKAELRELYDCGGFAVVRGARIDPVGTCPPDGIVADIARFALERGSSDPFATRELGAGLPQAAAHASQAAGLLALPLGDDDTVLLWFRSERIEEITWAGNPNKPVEPAPGETLHPRASFASYREKVRGRSRAWTLEEVEAAHRFRRQLREVRAAHQTRVLNAELQRTLAQKDVLIKEVNHRVQNSLQLVSSFLGLQARNAEPSVVAHLTEAQARLSAVALVHRRLYRDDQVETLNLARYLTELIGDIQTSLGADWARLMQVDIAPVLVPTDRAVSIGLVLTELVINATKYAYGGGPGSIAISLEQHGPRLRLIVADIGRGKASGGEGFGSRMMTALVARLQGTMEFLDNTPGLRAILTAPVDEEFG